MMVIAGIGSIMIPSLADQDGGGSSGGSGSGVGGGPGDVAHEFIWFDRGGFADNPNYQPAQGVDRASATYFLNLMEQRVGRPMDRGWGTVKLSWDGNRHTLEEVYYHYAELALQRARDKQKENGGKGEHARIVGVAWMYDPSDALWTFNIPGDNWNTNYKYMFPRGGNSSELSSEAGWDDPVDVPGYEGQSWRNYVYQMGADENTSRYYFLVILAVGDGWPTPSGSIELSKKDSISKGVIKNRDFKFQLYKDDKVTKQGDEKSIDPTTGTVRWDAVPVGKYHIKEIDASSPYTVNTNWIDVEVTKDNTKTNPARIDCYDDQVYGNAAIMKTENVKNTSMPNVTYDIIANEDIDRGDGTIIYKAGTTVQAGLKTSANGSAAADSSNPATRLYIGMDGDGKYSFVEKNAPQELVKDATPIPFTITYKNNNVVIGSDINVAQTDRLITTPPFKIIKTDYESNVPVEGAVFTLYASKDIILSNGTVIYKQDNPIANYTTGSNGEISIGENVLYVDKNGELNYKLIETDAPEGYVIDPTPIRITGSKKSEDDVLISVDDKKMTNKPNELRLNKTVLESITSSSSVPATVPNATFRLWNKSDELQMQADTNRIAYALRVDGGDTSKKVVIYQQLDWAEAELATATDAAKEYTIVLTDVSGNSVTLKAGSKATRIDAGTYTVKIQENGADVNDAKFTGDTKIAVKNGDRIIYSVGVGATSGKPTVSVSTEEISDRSASVVKRDGAYIATGVKPDAIYHVQFDGKTIYTLDTSNIKAGSKLYGRYDTKATTYAYKRQPMLLTSDSKYIDKFTINGKDYKVATKVNTDGEIVIKRIKTGSYGFGETDVPLGDKRNETFLINTNVFYFDVDGTTGKLNKQALLDTKCEDDYTKLEISKKEFVDGPEIPGASLELQDSNGSRIDSWISTSEPHYIDMLAPGKYTLIERITPTNYDQAERVRFEVRDDGSVQTAVMLDKPIEIKAELDKRQEIANPLAPDTSANGDGLNRAPEQKVKGTFSYSLDYRNDSNTWVDEFTVYDALDGVNAGVVRLDSLTTAQGYKDFDGKLNVWYQTNKTPADYADDKDKANATLDDGHTNVLISGDTRSENAKKNDPDGDGRVLDYTGWRLWRRDAPATAAMSLPVSSLGLSDGEYVTAIRLEYGRVEKGFATRTSAWNRDDLKDEHDDVDSVEYVHVETFKVDDSIDAVASNISTLVKLVDGDSDANGTSNQLALTKTDRAIIDSAFDRITEGRNAASVDEIRAAADDVVDIVSEKFDVLLSSDSVFTAKNVGKAADAVEASVKRVENSLPKDVLGKANKAIAFARTAADSGDPEKVSDAVDGLSAAVSSVISSLSSSAAVLPEIHYAPAVVRMNATDAYVAGTKIDNVATVDAYRNGGGEKLESHDKDNVTQTPQSTKNTYLTQTGITLMSIVNIFGLFSFIALILIYIKRKLC